MRRLPLAPEGPGDPVAGLAVDAIRPGGPNVVVVPIDEAAATEFVVLLLRAFEDVGVVPSLVVETSSKSFPVPEPLRFAADRTTIVQAGSPALADALRGSGPFVIVSFDAAAVVESSLVVAITAGVAPFLTRARPIRDRIDVMLDAPRPAFAAWLAARLSRDSGRR